MSADEQPDAPAPLPAEGDFERALEAMDNALRLADDAQAEWSAREDLAGAGFESSVWAAAYAGAGAGERQGSGSQGADLEADGLSPERAARAMWRDPGEPVRLVRAMFQARFEATGEPIDEASAGRLVAALAAAQREGHLGPACTIAASIDRATSGAVDAEFHARRLDVLLEAAVANAASTPVPPLLARWFAVRDGAAAARRRRRNVARDAFIWVALLCLRACGLSVTAYMEPFHVRLNGATPCSA